MKKINEIVKGKKVLFAATKNRDYLRNEQEINLIKENAASCEEIVYADKSYIKRIIKVWLACLKGTYKKADIIFVGFAPQLVMPFLKKWNKKKTVVIDFFISMYDTCVMDRTYFKKGSIFAKILHRIDENTLARCSHVIVDTKADADFFAEEFHASRDKMEVLYLEADTKIYQPDKYKATATKNNFSVLYFGSILPLQGIDVILEAQRLLKEEKNISFTMIGPVDEKKVKKEDYPNTTFYEWLSQEELAEKIAQADLCLAGHFHGTIGKASRTIPGKAYIYEAMGKRMILGDNAANHELFIEDEKHTFVKMGDAQALAEKIKSEGTGK